MDSIANVLADRYASKAMKAIWSARGRVILEREFWIAVLKAQKDLGLAISSDAIAAYEASKEDVDLESIRQREAVTRHDVKARIEEFCAKAGYEEIHKGMTSRDLTENVEQLQVHRSLHLVITKTVASLSVLQQRAQEQKNTLLTARTHNVAAQLTTVGKRWAMFGEELLLSLNALKQFYDGYPVRGLKGAVGTQLDPLTLFDDAADKVALLEEKVLLHLGIQNCFSAVGQVYPRSLDFDTIAHLYSLGSAPSSFARTLRLMAGHELASEGFAPGQVGSSAMPHKMNSRSCERLNGLHLILRGYLTMAEGLAGDQWNEGDVSCSVVRRVCLPDAFFAIDSLLETFLTILRQLEVNTAVIERENRHYLPFLLTTTVMMAAVKNGAGRESAHAAIKQHAVETARAWRSGEITSNDLFERLAADQRLGVDAKELQQIWEQARKGSGMAGAQVDTFTEQVEEWQRRYPQADSYEPEPIL